MENINMNGDGSGYTIVRAKDFTDSQGGSAALGIRKVVSKEKQLESAFNGSTVAELLDDIVSMGCFHEGIKHRARLIKRILGV